MRSIIIKARQEGKKLAWGRRNGRSPAALALGAVLASAPHVWAQDVAEMAALSRIGSLAQAGTAGEADGRRGLPPGPPIHSQQWQDPLGDWDPWFGFWSPPRPIRAAVTGRLISTSVIQGDTGEAHLAAGVWSRGHGYVPVDLGPLAHNRMTLQEGERVTVIGHLDIHQWSPTLAANRIRAGGRRIELFRPGVQETRITLDPTPPEQVQPIEVRVAGLRTVWYTGFPSSHLIAHVWLEGRMTNVDLGPARDLRGLDLDPGAELVVYARPGRINGRFALLAEEFQIGDQVVKVEQPA